jgi:hypothetical protein
MTDETKCETCGGSGNDPWRGGPDGPEPCRACDGPPDAPLEVNGGCGGTGWAGAGKACPGCGECCAAPVEAAPEEVNP